MKVKLKISIRLLLIISLLAGLQLIKSQKISEVFMKMPTSILPTLSEQQRFEMMEYFKSNRNDSIKNRFGNYVKMIYLDTLNQQLIAKTTEGNLIDIKLFRTEEDEVLIGVINTVFSSVELSNIQFFDLKWQVSRIQFTVPDAGKWFKNKVLNNTEINQNWLKNIAEQKFVKLEFSKSGNQIIVSNQVERFVSIENKKELGVLIDSQPLVYEFKGNEWRLK